MKKSMRTARLALLCCSAGAALLVGAASAQAAGLTLSNSWVRFIMPSLPAAGYFTLTNDTGKAASLVGAASPACGMLLLHKSMNMNGEESMVMVKTVKVPAHGKIDFAPGGYHLMCMEPRPMMKVGASVPVTLRFADGTKMTAEFPVRNAKGQ